MWTTQPAYTFIVMKGQCNYMAADGLETTSSNDPCGLKEAASLSSLYHSAY